MTAIGDSVMLGAKGALEAKIPGIHVDAAVSRQFGNGIDLIRQLKDAGQLSAGRRDRPRHERRRSPTGTWPRSSRCSPTGSA